MYKYVKSLPYPLNIKKKDLQMAKYIITQFGGSNGELAASMRYFSQKFTMPDDKGRALLNDIATEEIGHAEMISTMVHMLTKDATVKELKEAGLDTYFTEHGKGIYPQDSNGIPFTAAYIASTGDVLADLSEDMAAEQKARAIYENLIDLATDKDVIDPLLFLRQREIVHFNRFKELYDHYKNSTKNNWHFLFFPYNMDLIEVIYMRCLNFEFAKSADETIIITCYDNLGIDSKRGLEVGIISVDRDNTVVVLPNDSEILPQDYFEVKQNLITAFIEFTSLSNIRMQGPNYVIDNAYVILDEYLTIEKNLSL